MTPIGPKGEAAREKKSPAGRFLHLLLTLTPFWTGAKIWTDQWEDERGSKWILFLTEEEGTLIYVCDGNRN